VRKKYDIYPPAARLELIKQQEGVRGRATQHGEGKSSDYYDR